MLFLSATVGERSGWDWGGVQSSALAWGPTIAAAEILAGILVGISCRPCGLVELQLVLQQRPVFAAANSFRLVGAL